MEDRIQIVSRAFLTPELKRKRNNIHSLHFHHQKHLPRVTVFGIRYPTHCGPEQPDVPVLIIHLPTSKKMTEWCERMSERTSEWPSAYICLFWKIVPLKQPRMKEMQLPRSIEIANHVGYNDGIKKIPIVSHPFVDCFHDHVTP